MGCLFESYSLFLTWGPVAILSLRGGAGHGSAVGLMQHMLVQSNSTLTCGACGGRRSDGRAKGLGSVQVQLFHIRAF